MLYRHSAQGQTLIWGISTGTASDTIGEVWVCLDPVNHNHICQNEILAITLLQGYYLR